MEDKEREEWLKRAHRKTVKARDGKEIKMWAHRPNCACDTCKRHRRLIREVTGEVNQILGAK